MKELIDAGVYQYSLNSLEEAKKDADSRAQAERYFVLKVANGYVGPVNECKRKDIVYRDLAIAYSTNQI